MPIAGKRNKGTNQTPASFGGDDGSQVFAGWNDGSVSNELFVAAIESCPVGLSISDATKPLQPLVYINSAFTGITGYFLHEVIGRSLSLLYGPNTDAGILERIGTSLARNEPVDAELLHYRKNQTPFWCELRMTPITRAGRIVAIIGVHTDITEKRRRQIDDQRRQSLQALGQLAGGVAHELNNLLQPILTFADLALAGGGQRDPATARYLSRVIDSAKKARTIVHGILRFARGESDSLERLDVRVALSEAVGFVAGLIPPSVTLSTAGLDQPLGQALINTVELVQVLTNLLTNAVQAMQGRGSITIRAETVRLDLRQAAALGVAAGPVCRIAVADSGPGMSEAVQAHLFDPFFTTKPIGQGTGLGLSVVYGILQGWNGTISVASAPGKGAQFTLIIPCVETSDG